MTWCIAGFGKVATALAHRAHARGVSFQHVSARQWSDGQDLPSTNCRGLFLALSDDALSTAAEALAAHHPTYPVFHCSGATPLSALASLPLSGVWYPMQSFRSPDVPWGEFRIFWENETLASTLNDWHQALGIGIPGEWASSEKRGAYHLGAVWANNFPNHLAALVQAYQSKTGITGLQTMFLDSVQNALSGDAKTLQTGPALRGDQATLERHLSELPEEFRDLYLALSESIQRFHASQS
ncbi:MAG: DUF2520 domain-containing protein [Schleiferiaceae bacterium]|nr:DUF2520 domain-containing protein [Schleiferiaceae bacterium]